MSRSHNTLRNVAGEGTPPPPVEQLRANLRRVVDYVLEERELTDILLNHSTGFDRDLDAKILNFYDRIAALIQRSLDLGIEMQLVRQTNTRAIAYCILGAIKEVVGLLSRDGEADTSKLVEEILDFGLRGVARPELLESVAMNSETIHESDFFSAPE